MAGGCLLPVCRGLHLDGTQQQGECMKRIRPIFIFSFTLATAVLLAACGGSSEPVSPDCTGDGIAIIPTATRQTDPDLFSPPAPPDGGDGADYCPTPIPVETPAEDFPEKFITTEVVNLSLDGPKRAKLL